ncbi:MAG: polyprenyl synthetase family protein [Chitinophagaceae bacterium]|nr:polyprenyl synthetase family protein [Chitinophagaceae bacterium]
MQSFEDLSKKFVSYFDKRHFPEQPASLYEPNEYFLQNGGKRIRPVLCLMGHELFGNINDETMHLATAFELFHNFTLIHDDIMDNAPLRRGIETVQNKFGSNTALLAGDVMLIAAYKELAHIHVDRLPAILQLFNRTATQVCEGQQLDMDFESQENVSMDAYLEMITLKTSVALAASLQAGAILGGADSADLDKIYAFGKALGIAFQMQDDYLDAFGNPEKFGKQKGGDILANKKTFLLLYTLQKASPTQLQELRSFMQNEANNKVEKVIQLFKDCGVDDWAMSMQNKYLKEAFAQLDAITVDTKRKEPLKKLALNLLHREV